MNERPWVWWPVIIGPIVGAVVGAAWDLSLYDKSNPDPLPSLGMGTFMLTQMGFYLGGGGRLGQSRGEVKELEQGKPSGRPSVKQTPRRPRAGRRGWPRRGCDETRCLRTPIPRPRGAGEHGLFLWTPARPSMDEMEDLTLAPFDNRLGQGLGWVVAYGLTFVVLFYAARTAICLNAPTRSEAILWYAVLVLASLPYLWLLVTHDWNNMHALDSAYWVGTPVRFLLVPTVFFLDRRVDRPSVPEIFVLLVWTLVVWPVAALFCFGMYWI